MKGAAKISGLEKITEEDMEAILNDFDPIEVMAQYFYFYISQQKIFEISREGYLTLMKEFYFS